MRFTVVKFVALALLLALVIGCGGGGSEGNTDSGSACTPPGGETSLLGRWTYESGDPPLEEITFNVNGTFSGELSGGCAVSGTWRGSGGSLTLCVGSASPTCASHGVTAGSQDGWGYFFNGDRMTVTGSHGSTTLEHD